MAQPPKKLKGKLLEGFEKTKLHASSDGPFTLVQCSSPISPLAAKPWAFGQFHLPSRIFSSIMYTYAYFNVLQCNYFIYVCRFAVCGWNSFFARPLCCWVFGVVDLILRTMGEARLQPEFASRLRSQLLLGAVVVGDVLVCWSFTVERIFWENHILVVYRWNIMWIYVNGPLWATS